MHDDEDDIDDPEDPDPEDQDDSDEHMLTDTIACPYCKKEIAEEAEWCPHCGKYISKEEAASSWNLLWVFLVIVLAVLIVFASFR